MSLSLAIKIPDGIALITESREIDLNNKKILSNNETKYFEINSSIICAPVGVKPAIENTLTLIRNSQGAITDQNSLRLNINDAGIKGFNKFIEDYFPKTLVVPPYKLGILVGAILNENPILYGVIFGNSQTASKQGQKLYSAFLDRKINSFAAGTEQEFAGFQMNKYLQSQTPNWEVQDKCINDFMLGVMEKAKHIIEDVASRNNDVGGDIKYIILRNNYSIKTGVI